MGCFTNHAGLCAPLFGDDAVRPLDQRYENCGSAELCSPILQIYFRNPTGTGAGPSRKDRNVLRDDLLVHFAQRRPADRENLRNGCFPHEVGSLAGEENLHLVTCVGQRKAMRETKEARVGSSDPHALFIMIFSGLRAVVSCALAAPSPSRPKPSNCGILVSSWRRIIISSVEYPEP